jgi:hypothetical protein
VPTCEGWLLKGGQWRFFRLENEQLMWFDRQHTRRLRGKALVSLCSVFSATDDVLSFVVERDSSWSRTMHATSVDDSTTWQSYLVDVVRAAAERSVSLYARTAKARGDVQQRAGWAVLHGQKVWLLLRGGLMVWFATPAPSSRARGCLRLARAGLASLPRNAETVAKSGVLNVRTAGGRRLEFHVAEHFSEWHHDIRLLFSWQTTSLRAKRNWRASRARFSARTARFCIGCSLPRARCRAAWRRSRRTARARRRVVVLAPLAVAAPPPRSPRTPTTVRRAVAS